MATIELRLSNKVQKETGMSEVMICLRYSKHDLSARSGIYVNPSFFEYYIDRKKTTNPKQPIPKNRNTATLEKAVKNGWSLRKSGEIVTSAKGLQTEEVKEHNEKSAKMGNLKKFIIDAFGEVYDTDSLSSEWLKDIIDTFNNPNRQKAENPTKKTFYTLAEEYITKPHGKKGRTLTKSPVRSFRVMLRAAARYEGFVRKTDKNRRNWSWDIDKVTREDIEDYFNYIAKEKDLSETYPEIFKKLFTDYPPSVKPGQKKLGGRGESTLLHMERQLKALFTHFYLQGYTKNRPFDGVVIGTESYGTPIYISLDERSKIAETELRPLWDALPQEDKTAARMTYETLEAQRDIFVFQCLVGCRVGDLMSFTINNIHNGVLTYTPQKTKKSSNTQATVPLLPQAFALVEKYKGVDDKGRLFPFITPQRYNDAIKVVFKLSGVTRPVEVRNPRTGENELVPINEIASSHMARRTFIGNLYFKVQDPNLIGKMSGHVEGSTAFSRYRKIEDETLRNTINLIG